MNNERMLVRDANTGEMMEMCLKTGHLLKLGTPPSEDMKFAASALRHKKPVPAHLRPKEVAPIVVTAPPPAAPPAPPQDATPPPLPARVAAPTPPPPPPPAASTSASPASMPKSSVASTPAQSPRAASARKRRGSLLDGVNKLLGKETNPVDDLDVALGRLAKADLSAADKMALALKLRSYADWLDAATPKAASPAALVSTPAQDGFRYRFQTSPGDAQKALNATRLPLTTPEFERQASTSPLPSPEVTAKVLDTVVEMSNDELVAAVRAEAVRRASSTEEAAASASDDDAPPRAVSPTLEAARPVSPIMSPAQTPAAVDVVDAIRPIPDAVDAAPPPLVSRAASTKTATPQGHRVVTMSSGSVSAAPPPAEPAPVPPPSPEPAAPARTVEPYRPKSTGAAMLDAIEADILNLETTLEAAPPADADEGLISFDATPADDDDGFASFESAPAAAVDVDQKAQSPFEAAIAARRARSEAQTDAQRPDPLAGARVSVQ